MNFFMKNRIPQAWLSAVRAYTEGACAEFTVMPKSFDCSHLFIVYLPPVRIGLDDDPEGLLLIDNGCYLSLTEQPI